MSSRMEKYYDESPKYSRTMKNANLYKEIYGNYEDLDYFPIADNTNEIDMSKLKELVRESNRKERVKSGDLEKKVEENRDREEHRIYDINKILEKAREKNSDKEKEKDTRLNYSYLKTLESEKSEEKKPVLKEKDEIELKVKQETEDDGKLYETRELKFLNKQKEVIKEIIDEYGPEVKNEVKLEKKDLSPLDILEDLKPDENSFIVEPVKSINDGVLNDDEKLVADREATEIITSEDNSDIDVLTQHTKEILKQTNNLELKKPDNEIDNDFYTSSYKFSKKDFISDDDDDDIPNKSGGVIKIILLVIAIFALIVLIYYFVHKYGIGA